MLVRDAELKDYRLRCRGGEVIQVVMFAAGLFMGACTLVAICCLKVGAMHEDEWN